VKLFLRQPLATAATAIFGKIGVAQIDSNLATTIRTTVILAFSWGIALSTGPPVAMSQIAPRTWTFLGLSGLATGASWLCYYRALQLGPASKVAPIDKLSVALVILLAAVFLGEPLTVKKCLGGLLIVAGAVTLRWD